MESQTVKLTSSVISEEKELIWEIKDIAFLLTDGHPYHKELCFTFTAGSTISMKSKWKFYFERRTENVPDYLGTSDVSVQKMGFWLQLIESTNWDNTLAEFDVYINLNVEGKSRSVSIPVHDYCKGKQPSRVNYYREIFGSADVNEFKRFVHDGNQTIQIKFTIFSQKVTSTLEDDNVIANAHKACHNANKTAMLAILESGDHSDISFRTSDELIIPAHRNIIASQSPVFTAMFASEMKEKQAGIVDLDDIGAEALKIFLKFLYTGNLGDNWIDFYDEIINFADKYQVLALKDLCDKMLFKFCRKANCFELRKFAKLHSLDMTKEKIEEFILADHELLVKLMDLAI